MDMGAAVRSRVSPWVRPYADTCAHNMSTHLYARFVAPGRVALSAHARTAGYKALKCCELHVVLRVEAEMQLPRYPAGNTTAAHDAASPRCKVLRFSPVQRDPLVDVGSSCHATHTMVLTNQCFQKPWIWAALRSGSIRAVTESIRDLEFGDA